MTGRDLPIRHIVQICSSGSIGDKTDEVDYIYALCDDGSLWTARSGPLTEWSWIRLPNVPQPDDEEAR